jgi:hypothetical protein
MPACPVDVRDFRPWKPDPNKFRSAGFGEYVAGFAKGTLTFEAILDGPAQEAWREDLEYALAMTYWEARCQ